MHLKVAVCDDEIQIQFMIEGFLERIFEEYAIDAEIECFSSGEEFCDSYVRGKYDLIFLDIEFSGMNGVEIGRFIREHVGDETVQIAYVSGNTGYAMELFEYRPINFLAKPVVLKDIRKIVDKYLLLSNQKKENFQYKIGKDIFQISLSDILYFSSNARKVTVHRINEAAEFYGNLEQIYHQVRGRHFLYVHKSYIINAQFIKKMEYEQVTLCNDFVVPISQARRTAIRKQFLELKKEEL